MRDLKTILEMIRLYGINGEEVDCPKHLRPIWILFKGTIDRNAQAYADYIESRKKAGQMGYAKMMKNKTEVSTPQHNPAEAGRSEQSPAQPGIPLCVRDSVRDINISLPNGSESNAHAREDCKSGFKLTEYPETAEDVLAIAQAINTPMSQEQAQAYVDNRIRADWHQGIGGTGRKIKLEGIPADIRLWVDRDKAEMNRNKQQINIRNEGRYDGIIGGEYIPRN